MANSFGGGWSRLDYGKAFGSEFYSVEERERESRERRRFSLLAPSGAQVMPCQTLYRRLEKYPTLI
jgi:hypothetical protein